MAQRIPGNRFVYLSGVFAGVWVVAAWLSPENNYFLFPVLIAASVPISYRLTFRKPLSHPVATGAAAAGLLNAILVALLLELSGKLQGDPLIPGTGLVLEAMVLGLVGAAAGALVTTWRPTARR